MLAIVEAYRVGLLKGKNWLPNIMAGTIVGVVALPLAMAFAIASGAKPEQGLYTAIVAGLMVGLFGGSRVQIAGPTGAFIVILASITANYGMDGLQIATIMAGFMLVLMGLIRFGSVVKYIPDPVIVGFTSGIGVIIFVGEWKDFFGLPVHLPLDAAFHQKIVALIQALPSLNVATVSIAVFSLLLVIMTGKVVKRIPGPLVAMLVATTLQMIFQFDGVTTLGGAFGGIPNHLPSFQLPSVNFDKLLLLAGPAFTIAMLGAIESLLSATAADAMAGTRHHSNQELIGQGFANILAPLFGGFAATGAIARTATNVRNGGNSPISAVTHSVFLILVLVLLAPLAAYIPLCALAAILFVVAYNMSDVPHFIHILKRAPMHDVAVLLITFFLTVFTNLVIAVNVGVILAMILFIYRMNQYVTVESQTHESLKDELAAHAVSGLPNDILVYNFQGPLFFGVAEKVEQVLAITGTDPRVIVFRFKFVPFMDMTGLETFSEAVEQYHHRGITVYVCEANASVAVKLEKVGIFQWLEGKRTYSHFADLVPLIGTPYTISDSKLTTEVIHSG